MFHKFAGTRLLLLLLLSAEQRAMPYRRAAATCTGCGQPGHRKDNKRCPAYAINLELGIVKEKKRRAMKLNPFAKLSSSRALIDAPRSAVGFAPVATVSSTDDGRERNLRGPAPPSLPTLLGNDSPGCGPGCSPLSAATFHDGVYALELSPGAVWRARCCCVSAAASCCWAMNCAWAD